MQKEIEILNVKISNLSYKECLDFIVESVIKDKKIFVSTPNPEILLLANKDEEYKKILNSCDLNTPDGTGLIYASKYLKIRRKNQESIKERVCGSDMMISICADKRLTNKKIFLLGASEEVSKKTANILKEKFPHIEISGRFTGKADDYENSVRLINESNADIVFVAFGAPKQEIWIKRNMEKHLNVKLFMGIGGSFDFISGEKTRAPKVFQNLGLEWLYRFYVEPKRIKRILNAVFVFPYTVIKNDLFENFKK